MGLIYHHRAQAASLNIFLLVPADPRRRVLLCQMAIFRAGEALEALRVTLVTPLDPLPQLRLAVA